MELDNLCVGKNKVFIDLANELAAVETIQNIHALQ